MGDRHTQRDGADMMLAASPGCSVHPEPHSLALPPPTNTPTPPPSSRGHQKKQSRRRRLGRRDLGHVAVHGRGGRGLARRCLERQLLPRPDAGTLTRGKGGGDGRGGCVCACVRVQGGWEGERKGFPSLITSCTAPHSPPLSLSTRTRTNANKQQLVRARSSGGFSSGNESDDGNASGGSVDGSGGGYKIPAGVWRVGVFARFDKFETVRQHFPGE